MTIKQDPIETTKGPDHQSEKCDLCAKQHRGGKGPKLGCTRGTVEKPRGMQTFLDLAGINAGWGEYRASMYNREKWTARKNESHRPQKDKSLDKQGGERIRGDDGRSENLVNSCVKNQKTCIIKAPQTVTRGGGDKQPLPNAGARGTVAH